MLVQPRWLKDEFGLPHRPPPVLTAACRPALGFGPDVGQWDYRVFEH